MSHEDWMQRALALADRAANEGEVPVGAVVVRDGVLLGEGWNQMIAAQDPTAHAEIVALRDAARVVGNYRLPEATLYVTLEPCAMCAGALVLARVDRLVFGADDPKAGAVGSLMDLSSDPRLNHRFPVERGLRADECAEQLRTFFRLRRTTQLGSGGEIG
jgi:tRNA(adenine34) deaminase